MVLHVTWHQLRHRPVYVVGWVGSGGSGRSVQTGPAPTLAVGVKVTGIDS